jgi:hypothetical protein
LAIVGDRNKGNWQNLETLSLEPNTPTRVWLKDVELELLLIKQVFINKYELTGVRYLVSNELGLSSDDFKNIYQKRWSVEEYHKSLKHNTL